MAARHSAKERADLAFSKAAAKARCRMAQASERELSRQLEVRKAIEARYFSDIQKAREAYYDAQDKDFNAAQVSA